jgi:hypothetical protein
MAPDRTSQSTGGHGSMFRTPVHSDWPEDDDREIKRRHWFNYHRRPSDRPRPYRDHHHPASAGSPTPSAATAKHLVAVFMTASSTTDHVIASDRPTKHQPGAVTAGHLQTVDRPLDDNGI